MSLITHAFDLDITPGAIPLVIHVSEGDIGRSYEVTIKNGGGDLTIPSGTTATVEGTIGGNVFRVAATVSGNVVSFALDESMTAKAGKAWCKIKLTKDDEPVQTCAFILDVDKAGAEADAVINTPGFDAQINKAVEDWLDDNASIKNQADGLSENVFTTYDSFQTFVEGTTLGKYKWHIGGISPDTGANNSSRTEYARMYHRAYLRAGSVIDVDSGYKFTIARYSNNSYVSPASGSSGFIDGKSAKITGAYICPADGYYRIAIAPENGESLGTDGAEYAYPAEGENGWELGDLLSHLKIKWFRRETRFDAIEALLTYETDPAAFKYSLGGVKKTGKTSARSDRLRVKDADGNDAIQVNAGSTVSCNTGYIFNIAVYRTYTSEDDFELIDYRDPSTEPYTVEEDCYIRVGYGAADGTVLWQRNSETKKYELTAAGEAAYAGALTFEIPDATMRDKVDALGVKAARIAGQLSNLDKLLLDKTSDYYHDDDYLTERVSTVLSRMAAVGMRGDSFIWITDPHYFDSEVNVPQNGLQSTALMDYILKRTNVSKIFLGGDYENGNTMTPTQALTLMQQARLELADVWDKIFAINGNHEYNNPGATEAQEPNELPVPLLYQMFIKDKEPQIGAANEYGDYWIDNQVQKIRYFFIGCNRGATIRNESIAWFGQQIGQVPAGYTVVVLSHTAFSSADESGNRTLTGQFGKIVSIMDAANSSASVTVNNVAYNYTSLDVDVACAITGHVHEDYETTTTGGIPIIATTCDRAARSTSADLTKALRVIGTISEQAFDVVQIDTEARKIYLTRIGGSTIGAELVEGTSKVVDPDGDDTQYDATEWTIYSPYKDREFSY